MQENVTLVRQWLNVSIDDIAGVAESLSDEYTVDKLRTTIAISREQRVQQIQDRRQQRGRSTLHQIELFGQRDKVVAIYLLQTSVEPISAAQIFRVSDSKNSETWADPAGVGAL
ncbi:MAG: hypothetical protein ACJA2Q_000799 [Pseudohongiellaceae bacterium]